MSEPTCVCVTTLAGEDMYPTAETFVSENRSLTLKDAADETVAIYAPGSWTSVTRKPITPA